MSEYVSFQQGFYADVNRFVDIMSRLYIVTGSNRESFDE